jgi:carbon-monoxide dehydrogenase medium subunit
MSSFEYAAPASLDEAIALLKKPGARIVAGGHRLLVEPQRGQLAGSLLVDLRRIGGLAAIEPQPDGGLKLGAMTTLATIAANETIRTSYRALAEAAQWGEDAQVRNRATIGGSLAAADPQADLPAPILALQAKIQLRGAQGERAIGADELFTGPNQTALRQGEVITAIGVPKAGEGSGSAYEKFRHPATLRAICGVAACVTLTGGAVSAVTVALTGAADRTTRLRGVEKALTRKKPTAEALSAAAGAAAEGLTFLGDHFASAEYRRHLSRVLTERALKRALERAASLDKTKSRTAGGD